jgi:NAD(P)-dependent dehydrogenase (short-subunit alcohol dehydrogenase family)
VRAIRKRGKRQQKELNQEARKAGNEEANFLRIDIAKPESIKRAAEEFARQSGRLDALVNNFNSPPSCQTLRSIPSVPVRRRTDSSRGELGTN